MNLELSRRELLAAMSLGLAAPRLFGAAATGPLCLSMVYMNGKDVKFNSERYREVHLPLLKRALGDSIERIELRTAPRPQRDSPMPPSPIVADISIWIRDLPAFGAATQRNVTEINADLAKVTTNAPVLQYDQVISEWGKARGEVGMGVDSQALYYPNSEEAKWDADYYVNKYLPKMVEAYGGDNVIRRIEVRRGVGAQGGGKPAMINSVHIYANNNSTFGMAGMRAGKQLMTDAKPITTLLPYIALMRVQAVG
ncbi:MAG: hypothetical protein RL030_2059 [Pseudomonadota bacterium]